ncbi:MBL fold metallo-hydrolase [Nonomuraea sp. NPDC046570]|uniref:MBL fold metallo-hydrolase n=1 Tax=Nonomuraea sp. NPDC046570 TaxID=3155255 RepID=UPI0033F9046C
MRLISSGQHHATFEFGELQVISLRDGYIDMPPTRLRDEDGRMLDELPAAVPLAGDNLRLSVNAFFVTDGTRSVLIDTGASNAWHDPTMGLIYDALDEAGIDRAQVTDVAITHKHEDHVSGLIAPDGSEAFTKLERVWIGAGDTSVFTGRLEPIRDRVVPVSEKVAINDWTTAMPTPGHNPVTPSTTSGAAPATFSSGATPFTFPRSNSISRTCPGSSTATSPRPAPRERLSSNN